MSNLVKRRPIVWFFFPTVQHDLVPEIIVIIIIITMIIIIISISIIVVNIIAVLISTMIAFVVVTFYIVVVVNFVLTPSSTGLSCYRHYLYRRCETPSSCPPFRHTPGQNLQGLSYMVRFRYPVTGGEQFHQFPCVRPRIGLSTLKEKYLQGK